MRLALITIVALALAPLAGCNQGRPSPGVASSYAAIPEQGWAYGNSVRLPVSGREAIIGDSIAIADSIMHGSLVVGIRWADTYQYANLWVEARYHDGDTMRCDTANIVLADTYGHWLGTGLGASWQATDTIARNITINTNEPVAIRHIMRVDTLTDIEQVGIFFLAN